MKTTLAKVSWRTLFALLGIMIAIRLFLEL